jgi:hypothetical protein
MSPEVLLAQSIHSTKNNLPNTFILLDLGAHALLAKILVLDDSAFTFASRACLLQLLILSSLLAQFGGE